MDQTPTLADPDLPRRLSERAAGFTQQATSASSPGQHHLAWNTAADLDLAATELRRLEAENADLRHSLAIHLRRLDETWTAIINGWRLVGDDHLIEGVEYVADYMNGCDAVDDESIEQFERMMAKIRSLLDTPSTEETGT